MSRSIGFGRDGAGGRSNARAAAALSPATRSHDSSSMPPGRIGSNRIDRSKGAAGHDQTPSNRSNRSIDRSGWDRSIVGGQGGVAAVARDDGQGCSRPPHQDTARPSLKPPTRRPSLHHHQPSAFFNRSNRLFEGLVGRLGQRTRRQHRSDRERFDRCSAAALWGSAGGFFSPRSPQHEEGPTQGPGADQSTSNRSKRSIGRQAIELIDRKAIDRCRRAPKCQ